MNELEKEAEVKSLKKDVKSLNKLINSDLEKYKNSHKAKIKFAIKQLQILSNESLDTSKCEKLDIASCSLNCNEEGNKCCKE